MKGILFKPWKIKFIAEHPDMELMTRRLGGLMELMTRRLGGLKELNQNPDDWEIPIKVVNDARPAKAGDWLFQHKTKLTLCVIARPRYQVGETVYLKEAFMIEQSEGFDEPTDRPFKNDYEWGLLIPHYKLTDPDPELYDDKDRLVKWKSPLFMPEWAARYFITITGVRAERLQEITEEDAILEGFHVSPGITNVGSIGLMSAMACFRELWNSINKDYPWESNPFVWVIEFKKV